MKQRVVFSFLVVTFLCLSLPAPALAFPPLPSSFYGSAKLNGADVADGTLVRALIGGQAFAQSYTQIYQGDSVFSLDIPGDDPQTEAREGGREGDLIEFEIGGVRASTTGIWHAGTNVLLDLAASTTGGTPVWTPRPTRTPMPTPTSTATLAATSVPTITPPLAPTWTATPYSPKVPSATPSLRTPTLTASVADRTQPTNSTPTRTATLPTRLPLPSATPTRLLSIATATAAVSPVLPSARSTQMGIPEEPPAVVPSIQPTQVAASSPVVTSVSAGQPVSKRPPTVGRASDTSTNQPAANQMWLGLVGLVGGCLLGVIGIGLLVAVAVLQIADQKPRPPTD